jgi:prophage regulatory protein
MRLLRLPVVMGRTGLSRTSIDRLEKHGEFPIRRHISMRAVGWDESEIDEWLVARKPRETAASSAAR